MEVNGLWLFVALLVGVVIGYTGMAGRPQPDPPAPSHTHDWSVWRVIQQGPRLAAPSLMERSLGATRALPIGTWLLQERQCKDCGLVERHRAEH